MHYPSPLCGVPLVCNLAQVGLGLLPKDRVIRVWCIGCSDACAVTSNEPPDAPVPVLNVAPKAPADVPVSMESPRGFIFLNGSYTR